MSVLTVVAVLGNLQIFSMRCVRRRGIVLPFIFNSYIFEHLKHGGGGATLPTAEETV
jgi:hypothetical protein